MPQPYEPRRSSTRFYVPKTLVDDFDRFLDNDIPGAVMAFKHYRDWYDQFDENYEEKTERFEIYPDSTKSRYANTDNYLNVRCSKNANVEAGDIIVDPDGIVYLLDWEIPPQPNNKMSRALRCNCLFTFTRYQTEVVDKRGYLIEEAGNKIIAENMPCNIYKYDGRPDFSAISSAPGVVANSLSIFSVQYNKKTKDIRIGDEFIWGNEEYIIIDVSRTGMDIYSTRGFVTLQAKKKAGGLIHE